MVKISVIERQIVGRGRTVSRAPAPEQQVRLGEARMFFYSLDLPGKLKRPPQRRLRQEIHVSRL